MGQQGCSALVSKGKNSCQIVTENEISFGYILFKFLISRWMRLWQTAGAVYCASVCEAAIGLKNKFEKLDALKGDTIKALSH